MNRQKYLLIASLLALVCILSPGNVHAISSSHNIALIDWSSVQFTGDLSIEDLGFEYFEGHSSAAAFSQLTPPGNIDSDSDDRTGFDPATVLITSAQADVLNASASSFTNILNDFSSPDNRHSGELKASADAVNTSFASVEAESWPFGEFVALKDGVLTITIDYRFEQDLSTTMPGEFASANSLAALFLWEGPTTPVYSGGDVTVDSISLGNDVKDGNSLATSQTGRLTASRFYLQGQRGGIQTFVRNEALVFSPVDDSGIPTNPIPEPATMLLLGSGLLGAASVRKKRG